MALIFITGVSGIGKSTIMEELRRQGYEAYDTDKDGLSDWYNKKTGKLATSKPDVSYGTKQWFDTYLWTLQPKALEQFRSSATKSLVFLCGAPGNARAVSKEFDRTICLTLNDTALAQRVTTRKSRYKNEPQDILKWNKSFEQDFKQLGATLINATGSPQAVVEQILSHCSIYRSAQ